MLERFLKCLHLFFSVPQPSFSWCFLRFFLCWHVWKDLPALIVSWLVQPLHLASFLLLAGSTCWTLLWVRALLEMQQSGTFSLLLVSNLLSLYVLKISTDGANMAGFVRTLSAVVWAMALIHQEIWETISTSMAMFDSHMDGSQWHVVYKRSSSRVSTDQKHKPDASKQRHGKDGSFCLVLWQNCLCPPSELNFAVPTYTLLFSAERCGSLTHLTVGSGLWKWRHPDSTTKDFCLVMLYQASIFSVFFGFSCRGLCRAVEEGYVLLLVLLPPSKALNKCQNICILGKMPILIFSCGA